MPDDNNVGATTGGVRLGMAKKDGAVQPAPGSSPGLEQGLASLDKLIVAQEKKVELLKAHRRGLVQRFTRTR